MNALLVVVGVLILLFLVMRGEAAQSIASGVSGVIPLGRPGDSLGSAFQLPADPYGSTLPCA